MVNAEGTVLERRIRGWRSVVETRRIAELTLEHGASMALVARANGVNANQVFKWRRTLKRGELAEVAEASTALLPVTLSASYETRRPCERDAACYEERQGSAQQPGLQNHTTARLCLQFEPGDGCSKRASDGSNRPARCARSSCEAWRKWTGCSCSVARRTT